MRDHSPGGRICPPSLNGLEHVEALHRVFERGVLGERFDRMVKRVLEVDEAQDVAAEKYQRDFRPMGSTTNATGLVKPAATTCVRS